VKIYLKNTKGWHVLNSSSSGWKEITPVCEKLIIPGVPQSDELSNSYLLKKVLH
jgi:hypothetical protein